MATPCEATPPVALLLFQLEYLCKNLAEAFARQAAELDQLRFQQSVAIERGLGAHSTPLLNVATVDIQTNTAIEASTSVEVVPLFGVPQHHEDGHLLNSDPHGKASLEHPEGKSIQDANPVGCPIVLARCQSGGPFAVRDAYVKNQAELARLAKKEKQASRESRGVRLSRAGEATATARSFSGRLRDPTSSITKWYWDIIGFLFLVYDVLFIPMDFSFDLPRDLPLTLIEIFGLVYWTLDIGMTLTTGYYEDDDDQEPVMDFRRVVKNYFCSKNFPFDVSLVSIDWIIALLQFGGGNVDNLSAILLGRVVRVGRVLRLLKLLRISKASGYLESLRRWFFFAFYRDIIYFASDMTKMLFAMMLVGHYMVCVYYIIGQQEGSWLSRTSDLKDAPFVKKYFITGTMMSRRSNSYTRGVERDLLTDIERAFDVLALCVFNGFIAWVTSTVTNTMMEMKRRKRERNERIDYIRNYYLVQHPYIDDRIKLRLLTFMQRGYHEYRAAQQRNENEEELLKALPIQLAKDFRREAWKPMLEKHMFFRIIDGWEVEDICLKAVGEIFCRKHEFAFKNNGHCSRMLFVFKGLFAYGVGEAFDRSTRQVLVSLVPSYDVCDHEEVGQESWLSEPVLWTTSWQHRGSLLAKESGTFCAISPEALETLLKGHESALHDVVRYATKFVDILNQKADMSSDSLSDLCDDVMETAFEAVSEYLFD